MALKLFAWLTLLVVIVSALPTDYSHLQGVQGDIHSSGYGAQAVDSGHYEEENYGPAEYEFKYGVHDTHTGDIKSQEEVRKGDVVHGRYELIDSDGFRRIVEYTADDHNGFQAIVRREPTDIKIPVPERQHYAVPEQSYTGKNVYYVSSTAAPLAHYSPSGYDSSSLGYGGDDEEGDSLSGKYHH